MRESRVIINIEKYYIVYTHIRGEIFYSRSRKNILENYISTLRYFSRISFLWSLYTIVEKDLNGNDVGRRPIS